MSAVEKTSKVSLKTIDADEVNITTVYLQTVPDENNTYDPREFRSPHYPIKPWMAYFDLLRTVLGPGLVGMPVAMSASGLIVGNIFTIIIAITIVHTHALLLENLNEVSKQLKIPYMPYRYGFRAALLHGPGIWHGLGRNGPTIVATFMFLSQLGLCATNIIMTADSLRDIADWQSVVPAQISIFPCYFLLEVFMKNLKRISYVALLSAVLNTMGLAILVYHIFKQPVKYVTWSYEGTDIGGGLFTIGMCLFNFSAIGMILALDHSLKNAELMVKRFGVIDIGLGVPAIISLIIGNLGYWAFGAMEENCLRSLPYEDTSAMVAFGLYMVSMGLSYPLQSYPAIAMLKEVIQHSSWKLSLKDLKFIENTARPVFLITAFIIAYQVPFQGPFVAFVGTLCTTLMSVLFPVMMDISLRYNVPGAYGPYRYHLIKDMVILLVGFLVWILGIYFCAYRIHVRILASSSPSKQYL